MIYNENITVPSFQVDLLWNCRARIALEFGLSGSSFAPGSQLPPHESRIAQDLAE